MIWLRSASSAACRDRARRIGRSLAARRSIPGTQPTVEIAVRRFVIPASGRRAQAARTASRFIIGSPMPMNTAWSTAVMRRKCRAWSRTSEAVRLRPNVIWPVAQNVHVSGQPDCELRQSEWRPSRYRMRTASTGRPSRRVRKSAFTVPSRDSAWSASSSVEKGTSSARRSRSARGRSVIAS